MEPLERIYDVDYEACDSDSVRGSDSSDDCLEDFENEMQEELDRRVGINRPRKTTGQRANPPMPAGAGEEPLFEPGSSGVENSGDTRDASKPKPKPNPNPKPKPSQSATENANDEAFYDPDEDEDNERWAQRQRQLHIYPDSGRRTVPLPNSDAVLNCPGCMTVLCRDCQAHDTISGRYRAMFVFNCRVDAAVEVPGPLVTSRDARKRRRGDRNRDAVAADDNTVFHPFHCNFCQTRIGVVDNDDVYHFLYVLAS